MKASFLLKMTALIMICPLFVPEGVCTVQNSSGFPVRKAMSFHPELVASLYFGRQHSIVLSSLRKFFNITGFVFPVTFLIWTVVWKIPFCSGEIPELGLYACGMLLKRVKHNYGKKGNVVAIKPEIAGIRHSGLKLKSDEKTEARTALCKKVHRILTLQ